MHGDRIAVRIDGAALPRPAQGTIVEVLERRTKEVVGRLHVEVGRGLPDARQSAHHASRAGAERAARRGRGRPDRDGRTHPAAVAHVGPGRSRLARCSATTARPAWKPTSRSTRTACRSSSRPRSSRRPKPSVPAFRRTRSPVAKTCATSNSSRSTARTRAISTTPSGASARAAAGALIVAIADVAHYVRPGSAARRRSARARHLGVFPEPRAADAARGAVERPVLAEAGRRPPVPLLRAARRRRRPHHALALLRGRDALGRAAHLPRRGRIPREAGREATRRASRACASGCWRCTASTSRSSARAPAAVRSSSTRPNSSSSSTSRARSRRWSSTRATMRTA